MKRLFILGVLISLLLVGCGKPEVAIQQGSSGDAVFLVIRENGISADASEVVISNFHSGSRAEMIYRIHNATSKAVMPEIYLNQGANIADYSKAGGAVKAGDYIEDWLLIPELNEIPPGQIAEFTIALVMPDEAEKPADKIGFQIGTSGITGVKIQPAVGVWWIVNMR